jgi:hypothetical protein
MMRDGNLRRFDRQFERVTAFVVGAAIASAVSGCGGKRQAAITGGVQPAPTSSEPTTPPEALDQGLAANAARFAPDMQPEGWPAKPVLEQGGRAELAFIMQPGRCYTVVGFSPQGAVTNLDLLLLTAPLYAQPIAQDATTDGSPSIGAAPAPLCPDLPNPVQARLDIVATQGRGPVAVQLFSKPNAAAQTSPSTPSTPDNTDELLAAAAKRHAPQMEPEGAVTKQRLNEGEHHGMLITLAGGKCYTIVAVSPQGQVADIDMQLLAPPFFNVSAGSDRRTDNVAVIGAAPNPQCPIAPIPVAYKLDVSPKKGQGLVAIQVYSRTKR